MIEKNEITNKLYESVHMYSPAPTLLMWVEPLHIITDILNEISCKVLSDAHIREQFDYKDKTSTEGGWQVSLYDSVTSYIPNQQYVYSDETWNPQSENFLKVKDYIETVSFDYLYNIARQDGDQGIQDIQGATCELINLWTITQKAGEYNVAHTHPSGSISGNLYLEIPKTITDENAPDGFISFTLPGPTRNLEKLAFRDAFPLKPVKNKMIIFPSRIVHTVYPFKGEGQRRTVAWDCKLKLPRPEMNSD